jgi:hypothetical protein
MTVGSLMSAPWSRLTFSAKVYLSFLFGVVLFATAVILGVPLLPAVDLVYSSFLFFFWVVVAHRSFRRSQDWFLRIVALGVSCASGIAVLSILFLNRYEIPGREMVLNSMLFALTIWLMLDHGGPSRFFYLRCLYHGTADGEPKGKDLTKYQDIGFPP